MTTITFPPGTTKEDFAPVGGGLFAGVIWVTPDMQSEWLARNQGNRNLADSRVKLYRRVMENGLWRLNGEPLIFDSAGIVKNGQHRLWTGVAFRTLVVVGVEPDTMETIDTGSSRSGGTVFGLKGHDNAYALASICKVIYQIEHGLPPSSTVSTTELEQVLQQHPDLEVFLQGRLKTTKIFKHFSHGQFWGLTYLFSHIDSELANDIAERVTSGLNLTKGDPVHTLRERILLNASSSSKLPESTMRAFIIKTWNALYEGRDLRLLRWSPADGMPEISGLPETLEAREVGA